MEAELLYFEDCPSWRVAADRLAQVAAERGDIAIRHRQVTTDTEARLLDFVGSPSIRVDGRDLFEATHESIVGLACRVYPTDDGHAGAPTIDQIRSAIERLE